MWAPLQLPTIVLAASCLAAGCAAGGCALKPLASPSDLPGSNLAESPSELQRPPDALATELAARPSAANPSLPSLSPANSLATGNRNIMAAERAATQRAESVQGDAPHQGLDDDPDAQQLAVLMNAARRETDPQTRAVLLATVARQAAAAADGLRVRAQVSDTEPAKTLATPTVVRPQTSNVWEYGPTGLGSAARDMPKLTTDAGDRPLAATSGPRAADASHRSNGSVANVSDSEPGLAEYVQAVLRERERQKQSSMSTSSASAFDPAPPDFASNHASGNWKQALEEVILQLQRQLDEEQLPPGDRSQLEVRLHLLRTLAGQSPASGDFKFLDGFEEAFWNSQLYGLRVALSEAGPPVPSLRAALALQHFRDANRQLGAISSLDLRNPAICQEVRSFADVREFDRYEFRPDQEVLLYVELENFAAEPIKLGTTASVSDRDASGEPNDSRIDGYETEFRGFIEVLDGNRRRVWQAELPVDRQVCRNYRRDYYIAYPFHIPRVLVTGQYTLQLTVEDVKGRKHGQTFFDIRISE